MLTWTLRINDILVVVCFVHLCHSFRLRNVLQTVQTLTTLVYNLNTQLNEVKDRPGGTTPAQNCYVDQKVEKIQAQISNLAARMTLMENRISIIEAKVKSFSSPEYMLRAIVISSCLSFDVCHASLTIYSKQTEPN